VANLTWSSNYSVGVEELDKQHRRLIHLINRIPEKLTSAPRDAALGELLRALLEYSAQHFACEERRLREAGYPYLGDQEAAHNDFRDRLRVVEHPYGAM
jgi:hemerythrin-like metal-binding protein